MNLYRIRNARGDICAHRFTTRWQAAAWLRSYRSLNPGTHTIETYRRGT